MEVESGTLTITLMMNDKMHFLVEVAWESHVISF